MKFENIYLIEKEFNQILTSKKIWKDFPNPVCRFCGENEKSKFKKDAHIIPESLGNRFLISNFECDICNEKFSVYEDALNKFIGPIRTLGFVKGKSKKGKRIPKFKNLKTNLRIESSSNDKSI